MRVVVGNRSEKNMEEWDYCDRMTITIDGKKVFDVSDGEPEDSNLSRDFNDCRNIPDMLKMAYKAGAKGESLEVVNEDLDED
jgi:hypothetical protein